jgi:hypothetical protein
MNVVFTGPAFDKNCQSIFRADLTYACTVKGGITVQNRVDSSTDLIVASRIDTVKARAASIVWHLPIMSYPQFIERFLGDVEIERNGTRNKYVDAFEHVTSFASTPVAQAALELADAL